MTKNDDSILFSLYRKFWPGLDVLLRPAAPHSKLNDVLRCEAMGLEYLKVYQMPKVTQYKHCQHGKMSLIIFIQSEWEREGERGEKSEEIFCYLDELQIVITFILHKMLTKLNLLLHI